MNRRDPHPAHSTVQTTELDALLDSRDNQPGVHAPAQPGGRTVQPIHEDEVGYVVPELPQHDSPVDIEQVQKAAYFRAQARGFEPGYELEDWLWAEREVRQRAIE